MPEIAEVARIVFFIRKHLVGKTISAVQALDDISVFGKAGTSASDFQTAMAGKKILGAGQQGKYFWIEMSSPPHPLMHFGMTGWLKLSNEETYYYRSEEETAEWPPKFWKFILETKEEPKIEAAFVDKRRFGRVRLVDCEASEIRKVSPLKENGPDPVIDREVVTEGWVVDLLKKKKVPIKALLLDQGNISGIGNWVGDEILYNAKIHPEQPSNTLSGPQISQLHKSIHYICTTAVDLLGDSDKFPGDWLFKHRWGKGKKDAPRTLPSGEKIVFVTVGGRTSAVIPSMQRKTGGAAINEDLDKETITEANGAGEGKAKKVKSPISTNGDVKGAPNGSSTSKRKAKKEMSPEDDDEEEDEKPVPAKGGSKKRKAEEFAEPKKTSKKANAQATGKSSSKTSSKVEDTTGRRRSGRVKG